MAEEGEEDEEEYEDVSPADLFADLADEALTRAQRYGAKPMKMKKMKKTPEARPAQRGKMPVDLSKAEKRDMESTSKVMMKPTRKSYDRKDFLKSVDTETNESESFNINMASRRSRSRSRSPPRALPARALPARALPVLAGTDFPSLSQEMGALYSRQDSARRPGTFRAGGDIMYSAEQAKRVSAIRQQMMLALPTEGKPPQQQQPAPMQLPAPAPKIPPRVPQLTSMEGRQLPAPGAILRALSTPPTEPLLSAQLPPPPPPPQPPPLLQGTLPPTIGYLSKAPPPPPSAPGMKLRARGTRFSPAADLPLPPFFPQQYFSAMIPPPAPPAPPPPPAQSVFGQFQSMPIPGDTPLFGSAVQGPPVPCMVGVMQPQPSHAQFGFGGSGDDVSGGAGGGGGGPVPPAPSLFGAVQPLTARFGSVQQGPAMGGLFAQTAGPPAPGFFGAKPSQPGIFGQAAYTPAGSAKPAGFHFGSAQASTASTNVQGFNVNFGGSAGSGSGSGFSFGGSAAFGSAAPSIQSAISGFGDPTSSHDSATEAPPNVGIVQKKMSRPPAQPMRKELSITPGDPERRVLYGGGRSDSPSPPRGRKLLPGEEFSSPERGVLSGSGSSIKSASPQSMRIVQSGGGGGDHFSSPERSLLSSDGLIDSPSPPMRRPQGVMVGMAPIQSAIRSSIRSSIFEPPVPAPPGGWRSVPVQEKSDKDPQKAEVLQFDKELREETRRHEVMRERSDESHREARVFSLGHGRGGMAGKMKSAKMKKGRIAPVYAVIDKEKQSKLLEVIFSLQDQSGCWESSDQLEQTIQFELKKWEATLVSAGLYSLGHTVAAEILRFVTTLIVLMLTLKLLQPDLFPMSIDGLSEIAFSDDVQTVMARYKDAVTRAMSYCELVDKRYPLVWSQLELGRSKDQALVHVLGPEVVSCGN